MVYGVLLSNSNLNVIGILLVDWALIKDEVVVFHHFVTENPEVVVAIVVLEHSKVASVCERESHLNWLDEQSLGLDGVHVVTLAVFGGSILNFDDDIVGGLLVPDLIASLIIPVAHLDGDAMDLTVGLRSNKLKIVSTWHVEVLKLWVKDNLGVG